MPSHRYAVLLSLVVTIGCIEFAAADELISRIMVGSCARHNKPQPIWDSIVDAKPDLFLFIGDNIYGDSRDVNVLKAKYAELAAKPGYQRLLKTCPLLATWDDHDFGENDAGKEYPIKAESQKLFNDFYDVPADSPRRKRPGVYDAQLFGPEGKRVQVILLDTRYFRDALRKPAKRPAGRGPYTAHKDDTKELLGEAQWKWLEEQLRTPADLRIIASSIQVIHNESGWECWGNFPSERQRLFDLIAKTKAGGVLMVSGDRHHAELSRITAKDSGAGYPLYDLTASSLNQPGSGRNKTEPNRHRLGENYLPINFGSIVVNWNVDDPAVTLSVHDAEGKSVRSHEVKLSELSP